MRTDYNKLVRDKIPEIITRSGNQCEVATYSDSEYIEALRQKLVEEAQEVVSAPSNELVSELADLYEVIDSLLLATGIDRETVIAKQKQKHSERGGFKGKIKLLWTKS
jgi:predicted house-cleaning noncanonical NTP pyrophosphatase (MazG superfamily)